MENIEEDNNKRKEEILEKARLSQQDEGIEYAVNQGTKLGNYYTEGVGVLLIVLCLFTEQILTAYALLTLYGAHCFGEFLAKYRYLNQKRYMIAAIVFGIIFGGTFAFLFVRGAGLLQGWWD